MHYMRWWKHGEVGPAQAQRHYGDPITRFYRSIKRDGDCWIWQKSLDDKGYPLFKITTGRVRSLRAHRFAYELIVAPIKAGLDLDHLCRRPACVNPAHLEPVTHAENVRRIPRTYKTHCPAGHLRTLETWDQKKRQCLECGRIRSREYQRKRREACYAAGLDSRGNPRQ